MAGFLLDVFFKIPLPETKAFICYTFKSCLCTVSIRASYNHHYYYATVNLISLMGHTFVSLFTRQFNGEIINH